MLKPRYQITHLILDHLTKISAAREVIINAPLVPKWELDLRREALIRSAHASTSIEGNSLSYEEVSNLEIGREVTAFGKDRQEVLNYFDALKYLDKLIMVEKITNKDILKLHKMITTKTLDNPEYSGKYRHGNQYVIVGNRFTGEITYKPPATREVPELMEDFLDFINEIDFKKLNPVLVAGIVHYEFVRIHPFIDGNGRTARILATYILLKSGFDTKRFFALDDFYNSDRPGYYAALKTVNSTKRELTEWLEYFCEGVDVSLEAVRKKIMLLTGGKSRDMGFNQIALGEKHMKIVEYVRKNASVTNKKVRELLNVSNKTAYQVLETLCKYNVLAKRGGGRNVFYILE
ncbi:Fic family protein [Patescibacteria group bacterium]|nr:Fic family protein [Patescibacteria group bacterium]MBU1953265.1 Fic family protein [Patescibacteria group bacterium]